MEKSFNYTFSVRGYELDSFGHVNNAVYINYLEQARWEILNELNLLKFFQETGSFLVVTQTKIRYINELKLFDKAYVETKIYREGFFVTFKQNIFLAADNKKIAKSTVQCLFVDINRTPQDIPDVIYPYLHE